MKKIFFLLIALLSLSTTLAAREVLSINDNWKFYFSSENSADYARTISLPHTWAYGNSNMLLSSQPSTANYIREIFVPKEWEGRRLFVKFYGVESVADLSVNGRYVGEHRGGATAFTLEITSLVNFNESNRLHVVVNDAPQNDILPTSTEKNSYGGIYRDVELIVTDQTTISPLYYGSDGVFIEQHKISDHSAEGAVRVHLDSPSESTCQLAVSVFDPAGKIVFQKLTAKAKIGAEPVSIPYAILSPKLWGLDHPNLYRFEVKAIGISSSDLVVVESGFRSIEMADTALLRINGEPIQIRSVALYHDYPHVGGAASARDIEADVALIDEVGANTIRSMTHPHHQYLYDLCDRDGRLVWIDTPLSRASFLSDVAYYPTERFHAQGLQTLREIIAQNYNHPSVVMWGIYSLLTTRGDNPIEYIKELNAVAKLIDPSRLTIAESDQDGSINTITDLIIWRQMLGWNRGLFSDLEMWSDILHSKWSHLHSAVSYGQSGRIEQQSAAADYKSTSQYNVDTWMPEGRQRQFHEEYADRLLTDSLFWGVCLNSMFDFKSSRNALGENNSGLMSFDRRERKDIFHLYKAHWNKSEPTLHIADKRYRVTTDALHAISVYASDTLPPTLYTQFDTVVMDRRSPWHFTADSILLKDGLNKLVVQQGEMSDSVDIIKQESSRPQSMRGRGIR